MKIGALKLVLALLDSNNKLKRKHQSDTFACSSILIEAMYILLFQVLGTPNTGREDITTEKIIKKFKKISTFVVQYGSS